MNYTKAAITDTFMKLLEEKPYNKITVRDIVDHCEINRNTFYYYYHDIPELLEMLLKEKADQVISEQGKYGDPADCLGSMIRYCAEHRKAALHIYRSEQREIFLQNLNRIAVYVVEQFLNAVGSDLEIRESDRLLLVRFYKSLLVGITLDWLDCGMEYDLLASMKRLSILHPGLYPGAGKETLRRCAEEAADGKDQGL